MRNISKYVLSKKGHIIEESKDIIIFMLCTRYYYIVRKINNSYVITKNKKDKSKYIIVSPEVKRDTQSSIIHFLKCCRN